MKRRIFQAVCSMAIFSGCAHVERESDIYVNYELTADVLPLTGNPDSKVFVLRFLRKEKSKYSHGEADLRFPDLVSRLDDGATNICYLTSDGGQLVYTTDRSKVQGKDLPRVEFSGFSTNGLKGVKYLIHWNDEKRRDKVTMQGSVYFP
jgi:hypothetical protein